MYQFPDANEVMGDQDPEPLDKRSRYKIIIIGNLLLALFIAIGIWFLFFFEPNTNITAQAELSVSASTQEEQSLTGDFTPIIIDNLPPEPIRTETDQHTIPAITDVTENTSLTPTSFVSNEIKKASFKAESNAITHQSIKTDKNTKQNNTPTQPLSAIDAITNELMKNKQAKINSQQTKSTVLEPNNKIFPVTDAPLAGASSENKIEAQQKKRPLAKNQIIVEQTTEKSLEKLINKSKQNLTPSDLILVNELTETGNATTSKQKTVITDHGITYNSISPKKTSDLDKIMAAMGGVKKSPEVNAIEKIETKVKKLLKNEKHEHQKTDTYVKKLLPETEENKKEIRTITVKQGEKLWDIAVRAYGDGSQYKKILEANPILKENPKLLKSGVILRVPL